jgi:hypothetical protein
MAIRDLKLVAPSRDQAIVIERVVPSAPPAKSIVARREIEGGGEKGRKGSER